MGQGLPVPGAGLVCPYAQRREVAMMGGGIASALLSLALLHRGWQVTLYCADDAPRTGLQATGRARFIPY
ncbi:hypothetical protein ACNKHO_14785 [Shigella flexneri]